MQKSKHPAGNPKHQWPAGLSGIQTLTDEDPHRQHERYDHRTRENRPGKAQAFRVSDDGNRTILLEFGELFKGQGRSRQRQCGPTADGHPAGRSAMGAYGRRSHQERHTCQRCGGDRIRNCPFVAGVQPTQRGVPGRQNLRKRQAEKMRKNVGSPPEDHDAQQ